MSAVFEEELRLDNGDSVGGSTFLGIVAGASCGDAVDEGVMGLETELGLAVSNFSPDLLCVSDRPSIVYKATSLQLVVISNSRILMKTVVVVHLFGGPFWRGRFVVHLFGQTRSVSL